MRQVTDKTTGEIIEYTEEQFIEQRDKLLTEWQNTKKTLETAKEKEAELREQIVNLVSDPNKDSGTENVDLGQGYKLKMVKKVNYGFIKNAQDKIDREAIEKALQRIETRTPAGVLIVERLLKWQPELSLTEYKLLSDEDKKEIDAVIVTSGGRPTLEIVEPKAKK